MNPKIENRVYIIAEAGVNHNGSLDLALRMIDAAAESGADAVKFQTFRAGNVVRRGASKADYQKKTTDVSESQLDMLRKLELDNNAHWQLMERCRLRGVQFLSSPFDMESIEFLAGTLNLPFLKLPSGEITNAPFLLKAALTGKSVILSTGMCSLADIETALGVLAFGYLKPGVPPSVGAFIDAFRSSGGQQALRENATLLHCTTEYPAPFEEVNLRSMETMNAAFGLKVGLSDHTEGIAVPVAAAARGAAVIEKHFTLDRGLPGPDHKASLEPDELKTMVRSIHQVSQALGSPLKLPAPSEIKNMKVTRKSLVAACGIKRGELFAPENIAVKRPGDGISPIHYWELLGRKAGRDFAPDEAIEI
jgi:N-acetylneuraminate synthase